MRRVLSWSLILLVTLVVTMAAWLWTADLGVFKSQVENWVTETTGRAFAIDGTLSIDLARSSVVIAKDVRFENADWADTPQMVTIGRAEIHLDLQSLFKGPVVVELIEVDDARIHLVSREELPPNWELEIDRRASTEPADRSAGPPFLLRKIDVTNVNILVESPQRVRPLDIRVESLNQRHRPDDVLELSLSASIDENPVALQGEAGGWHQLLAGADVRYSATGQLGTFEFETGGWIDDFANLRRPSLTFAARGPHINDLLQVLGLPEDGEGNIDLVGSLAGVDGEPLELDIKGNLGRMEIEAKGSFSDLQSLEQVDLELLASGPDLGRILGLFGFSQFRESPFMINIDATRVGPSLIVNNGEMIFAEARFDLSANVPNFPGLDDSRIKLGVSGPSIERFRYITRIPGQATGPFAIAFEIDVSPQGVELLSLDIETSLGRIEARGSLGDAPGYLGSELEFRVFSDDLGQLGAAYGVHHLPRVPLDFSGGAILEEDGIQTRGPLLGKANDVEIAIDGRIALARGLTGSDFDFDLAGPDLAELIGAFGVTKFVPDEQYDLRGQLQVRDDGYRFRKVEGVLGTSTLSANGLLVPRGGLAGSWFQWTATGPAFEELIDTVGSLAVNPGAYELSGELSILGDQFRFKNLELNRDTGTLGVNLVLGRPGSAGYVDFDIRARGRDLRALYAGTERFEMATAPFSIDLRGTRRGKKWAVDKFDVEVGEASAQARGELDFATASSSTRFRFSGNIPDLSKIATIDGRHMRPQPITWDARVSGGSGIIRIEDLDAALGDSDINGSFVYRAGQVPEFDIDLDSESIVFAPLIDERSTAYDPAPERSDGRLIPDIAMPFDALKKVNAAVNVTVRELHRDSLHLANLKLKAYLRDGVLEIDDAGFDARSGYLRTSARIAAGVAEGTARWDLIARDFALGMSDLNLDLAMTGDIDISLESRGNDLRTLLDNANGVLMMNTRGGRATSSRILQMLYGDLLDEIISTVNPFHKSDPYTEFSCVVLPLQIVDGVVSGEPNAYIETSKMRVAIESRIDLETEHLDMSVRTSPRRGIGISAGELVNPFVQIEGTLARPRLAVDEQGVLLTGGAAVATGGISLLAKGLWDRLSRSRDPCGTAAERGLRALSDQFPVFEPVAGE